MTEQKPWDEIGITEDKFYSVEAIEYWKQYPLNYLWEHILNVGGSHLSNIRTFCRLLSAYQDKVSTDNPLEDKTQTYLNTIKERSQKLEDMFILVTKRLQAEMDNTNGDETSDHTD